MGGMIEIGARYTRRRFLIVAGGAAGLAAVGCTVGASAAVGPTAAEIGAAESKRRAASAAVRDFALTAHVGEIGIGSRRVRTWSYGGQLPGPELRVKAGDVLRAVVRNDLPDPTTIHWHGIALRNDMDGVPGMTQAPIAPGTSFTYEFAVPDPGTYFFHPHVGLQLDRGLYGPLIVEDPREPLAYDRELVIVLDDWTDGVGETPDAILARLKQSGGTMPGMPGMPVASGQPGMPGHAGAAATAQPATAPPATMGAGPLGGDGGDIRYPLYLVNGRPPEDPATFDAKPGERLRLRIINAGSDTAFRIAVGAHMVQVTHSDGFPVRPVDGDAILIGMGERYDALLTVGASGRYPIVALAEGKGAEARAVLRVSGASGLPTATRPRELDGRLVTVHQLRATAAEALAPATPTRTHRLELGGGMMGGYRWTINGKTFDAAVPLPVRSGERVRLLVDNRTMMFHPMHLHGHTFAVVGANADGPRKDTVIVRPMESLAIDLVADNPGQWAIHCHNLYHAEAGMMTTLSYVR